MAKVSDLPNELLRYLLQMLTPEDRKLAVLVDRKWRKVGEDPVLWKWCIARIKNGADINKLSVGRFKYVQQIDVDPMFNWQPQQLEELFQATLELPKLKEIDGLAALDLSFVNSDLLGRALGKLDKLIFIIGHGNTTNAQNMAIFNEMAKNCCMKILRLEIIDLVELDVEILSRVMSGLQELLLSYVSLTSDQVLAVFKSMSENNQLNKVGLYSLNVSSVEPDLFGRGLSKLEEVTLYENNLTHGQVQTIFIELKQNCKLKLLSLCYNNLSSAHPDDLSMVVNNIEVVRMQDTQLSKEQITAVLTRAQQNTKLKTLDILGNDISEVDPVILETAGEILEELHIDSDSEDEESDEDENLEFSASENDIVGESDI